MSTIGHTKKTPQKPPTTATEDFCIICPYCGHKITISVADDVQEAMLRMRQAIEKLDADLAKMGKA